MRADTAWYRLLVPPASKESVAQAGYLGFALGWRVVVPGLIAPVMALALRVLPHRLMSPIIQSLLQPRGGGPGAGG
jgi:hypothetical protein